MSPSASRGSGEPQVLREVPGHRRVSRTWVAGQECVTRVLLSTQLPTDLGPLVEKIVLHGHGTMLGLIPEDLQLTLEGYRVAARLPRDLGPPLPWTHAVAAGVDADGYVSISTGWVEGTPLHHVATPSVEDARARALDALRILVALHACLVTYGDFKPENLVLRPDGSIALIDLDTLREVANPTAYAPTRDLTRSWAAPEQEREQRTYLASDLWSWAQLVEHLFPAGAPPEWRSALDACRLHDPLRRPRTEGLLAHLELGAPLVDWLDRPTPPPPGTSTERVPEATPAGPSHPSLSGPGARPPFETERVPERTGDLDSAPLREGTNPSTITTSSAPRPVQTGCLLTAFGVLAVGVLTCGGLGLAWNQAQVSAANDAAEDALSAMKANKTRAELNRDKSQREKLRALAADAVGIRATPRAEAVHALATVWAQGFQDSNEGWHPDRYEAARSAVAPVEDSRDPVALLARGTLDAAVCRLNRLDATAAVHCGDAVEALVEVHDRLPEDAEHHWLRVEATWTEVLVRSELVAQAQTAGLPPNKVELDAGRAACARAEAWFAYAPVNGPELFEDCLRLAGSAADVPQYLHWADLLVRADLADGALREITLKHVYAGGGPGCESTDVDKRRGDWQVKGQPWCLALGHAARGCWDLAHSVELRDRGADPDHPWDALSQASASPSLPACAR
ncbi:MAG: hypothetical protein Q8P41_27760 [Pseudomonadota bacterium]|nr:hypothetical protein [Pseudomonadota bacterium]